MKRLCYLLFLVFIVNQSLSYAHNNERFPFYKYARKYNFGDFMPKDQGGKFIQMEILGTEDDALIVEKIQTGVLENIYDSPIKWTKFEKTEIEKSVWVNRLYFLPSFARMYYLTKDRRYISDMMRILSKWIEENPKLPGSEKKTFNWRDMQVAWRTIHLCWCYYLTEEALSQEEKNIIVNLQKSHVEVLLSGFAKQKLNDFNHQSHGALAMLYIATLFPELDVEGQLKSNALRILTHHLHNAHYKDGGNVEQMFGYFPFQTAIFRDTYLLCKQNNIEIPIDLVNLLDKMATYMSDFAQPDWSMPAINDSYEMDVLISLSILSDIFKKDYTIKQTRSIVYPDTQIAVIKGENRANKWYLIMNPAKRIGSHAHAGRLALNLWYNNNPIFIDAGCCNYDKRIKNRWYRTSKAHNTILIDGIQDAESSSNVEYAKMRYTENKITDWEVTTNYKYCQMTSYANDPTNNNVEWTRNIALIKDDYVLVYDHFKTDKEHKYSTLFHLPPIKVLQDKNNKTINIYTNDTINIFPVVSEKLKKIDINDEFVYIKGKDYQAPMLTYNYNNRGDFNTALLIIPQKMQQNILSMKQKDKEGGSCIIIEYKNNRKDIILIKSKEYKSIEFDNFKTTKSFEIIELQS